MFFRVKILIVKWLLKMFKINDRVVGDGYPPFIIAEMSANHGGSIERAKKTIFEAKKAGAKAQLNYNPILQTQ